MKRLLMLMLLAAFTLPTAKAFGKGTEVVKEVDDVAMGQILSKDELESFQGLSGNPSVVCKYKQEKDVAQAAAKSANAVVAGGEESSSKRGG